MLRVALVLAFLVPLPLVAQDIVPIRAIRAHTLITPDDLETAETSTPGAHADMADIVGREARVTLYPGRPVLKGQTASPALVERNQMVRMHFSQGALNISAEGRVLERGGAGETVRVMNLASRQIVSGRVDENGLIKVVK